MLVFSRPSFRSGVMILRVTVEGAEVGFTVRARQNGESVNFGNEAVCDALLDKYPQFLSEPA